MRTIQKPVALLICVAFVYSARGAETQASYTVKYSGGSLPSVKGGQDLKLFLDQNAVSLYSKNKTESVSIPANAITEVSYGQEVHRRIGTAVGLAVISLGIGALVAFSKSKKHYVGVVWDAGDGKRGGIVLQADKNEYRGLIAGLEGVTGKKAIDTDALTEAAAKSGVGKTVPLPATNDATTQTAVAIPTIGAVTQTTSGPSEGPKANPATATSIPPQAAVVPTSPPTPAPTARVERIQALPAAPVVTPLFDPNLAVAVTFASNPPGAVVSCRGVRFGETPFVISLKPGTYTIKFANKGYPDWVSDVTVDAGKTATIVAQLDSTTGVILK